MAELHEAQTTFPFYRQAVQEIASGATAYERHTALTAWRYAAARSSWASPCCGASRRRSRP